VSAFSALALSPPPTLERRKRFLQAGQVLATLVPTEVTTILGSCVAACVWDAEARLGGINHFLLPQPAGKAATSPRFGNIAMEELRTRLVELGASPYRLRASVFGGGCMFAHLSGPDHLGARNVEVALTALQRANVELVAVEVGGNRGRKLRFVTDEGVACSSSI
jgi:chemotaxis protein CheD